MKVNRKFLRPPKKKGNTIKDEVVSMKERWCR